MAGLSRKRMKDHDDALALLSLSRKLKPDEVELVLRSYEPGLMTGKMSAYFTPESVAWAVAVSANASTPVMYVDLGAGIGALTWALHRITFGCGSIVAIEKNPEFVDVGRKLMPNVEWICGDIFDRDLWQAIGVQFHVAVSNPPFGKYTEIEADTAWLKFNGASHLMAAEVAVRVTLAGAVMVLPQMDLPFLDSRYPGTEDKFREQGVWHVDLPPERWSRVLRDFTEIYPEVQFHSTSTDVSEVLGHWKDVKPRVEVVDVKWDDAACYAPPSPAETFGKWRLR